MKIRVMGTREEIEAILPVAEWLIRAVVASLEGASPEPWDDWEQVVAA